MAAKEPTLTVWQGKYPYVSDAGNETRSWYWHFTSTNGRKLADSGEGYLRRIRALQGAQIALGLSGIEGLQPGQTKRVRRGKSYVRVVVEGGAK